MRMMGLDIGERRIGVALCDAEEILASPHSIIIRETDEAAIEKIDGMVKLYNIKRIVIGVPYSLNNTSTDQTVKTKSFINKIEKVLDDIDVVLQDERLTTVEAQKLIQSHGSKRSKKKVHIDDAVASLILQSYLDYHDKGAA
ncbi:MAG TPA: Holliday junction resolvase RuvX [Dehalococcoidia bacterium]|nr:Holliday junction resolvase RuvX [Dehalococcoidia bacterium]